MKYKRILIFGAPGYGKSFFSREISKVLNIPAFDLDDITWKNEKEKVIDKQRDKNLAARLKNKSWIIEGPYAGDWLHSAFIKSDFWIILKTNRMLATKRIIHRSLKRKLGKIKGRKTPIKELPRLLKYAWQYDYFPKYIKLAKKYKKPFIILRSKKQIKSFLENLK